MIVERVTKLFRGLICDFAGHKWTETKLGRSPLTITIVRCERCGSWS